MNILETAKEITRNHAYRPAPERLLREVVLECLSACAHGGFNVIDSEIMLTGRILDKFHVEVKHGNS
jgi:hypothetical protein